MGNKIFINLVESFNGDGVPAAGDDLLVLDFGDLTGPVDWHFTQQCVGNNSNSLCGDPDTLGDGAGNGVVANASVGGAGSGHVFYEFSRPLESRNGFAPSPPQGGSLRTDGRTDGRRPAPQGDPREGRR